MKRRKFLLTAGAVGTAGAAVGTGAFNTVSADRDVSVTVADDSEAYLVLDATDNDTDFIDQDPDGQFRIRLDDSVTSGEGVNPNAVTTIEEAFRIQYQGTETFDGLDPGVNARLFKQGSEVEDLDEDAIQILPSSGSWPDDSPNDLTHDGSAPQFGLGDERAADIVIDTTVLDDGGEGLLVDEIEFSAGDPFEVLQ